MAILHIIEWQLNIFKFKFWLVDLEDELKLFLLGVCQSKKIDFENCII